MSACKSAALAAWLGCFVLAGMSVFLSVSWTVIIILSVALLIPAIPCLGLCWETIRHLREAQRHGTFSLQFEDFPLSRGKTLCASLLCLHPMKFDELTCTVICKQTTTTMKRREKVEREQIVVRSTFQRAVLSGGYRTDDGFAVSIEYDVPADAPLRQQEDQANKVEWVLHIKTKDPRFLFDASYQFPIYR